MIHKTLDLFFLQGFLSTSWCYFVLVQEPKTWTEAQSFCREFHLDLATVQSDEDRREIQKMASAVKFTQRGWMGLHGGVCVWRWSLGDETPVFSFWEPTESTSSRTQRMCGVMKSSGHWFSSSCEELKPFFCYKGSVINDKYVLVKVRLSWRDAQRYCRTSFVDLASVTTVTENMGLLYLLTSAGGETEAWIGLFKNLWLWSDQSAVRWLSVSWASNEPNNGNGAETCASAQADGLTVDDGCSQLLPFFCLKRAKAQVLRVELKAPGSLDGSALMEVVLKKINTVLTEQKMDSTSIVSWRIQTDGQTLQPLDARPRNSTAAAGRCV